MSTTTDAEASTKVVTGTVRLSYAHIWEAVAMEDGGDKKFSVSIIIPKSDKAMVAKLQKAIKIATEQGKAKWGGKIPSKLTLPLRDGDIERPEDEAYENSFFINAKCKTKPGVVDKNLNAILDQDEVYSGCYGRVSITFYPFDAKGNKGVACGLNHIMKVKDGEPLGGRSSAESDFADLDDIEDDEDLM